MRPLVLAGIFYLLIPFLVSAQKIIAVDTLTGVTRHIKIGKVLLVSTKDEVMDKSQLYSYSDSILVAEYVRKYGRSDIKLYNEDGIWRLSAIDNEKKILTITTSYLTDDGVSHTVKKEFRFEDIRHLTYVRARYPSRASGRRLLTFAFGAVVSGLLVVNVFDNDALGDPRPWVVMAAASWITFFVSTGSQKAKGYRFVGIKPGR